MHLFYYFAIYMNHPIWRCLNYPNCFYFRTIYLIKRLFYYENYLLNSSKWGPSAGHGHCYSDSAGPCRQRPLVKLNGIVFLQLE